MPKSLKRTLAEAKLALRKRQEAALAKEHRKLKLKENKSKRSESVSGKNSLAVRARVEKKAKRDEQMRNMGRGLSKLGGELWRGLQKASDPPKRKRKSATAKVKSVSKKKTSRR
jgi:hypothetical protein